MTTSWRGNVETGVSAWLGDETRPEPHHGSDRGPVRGDPVPDAPPPERGRRRGRGRRGAGSGLGRVGDGGGRRGRPGQEPSGDTERDLGPEADPESVARTILLDQLTGRARTRHELADKLRSRNVPDEVADRLLDRFTEVGLIDDAAFARQWVESRQSGKGLARRALADELRRKGVETEVAREALDEIEPGAEEAAARALVRKKLPSVRRLDRVVATRRLAGMLARKGYPAGMVFAVVREELGAAEADDDTVDEMADDLE